MVDTESRSVVSLATEVWSRRKWIGLLLFAGPMAATISMTLSLPDIYSSSATVLIEQQQVPEWFVKSSVTGEADTRLHMIREKLLNRTSLLALVTQFDLYPDLRKHAPHEVVVDRMRRDVTVELKELQRQVYGRDNTFGFKVSYRGGNSQKVAAVANTLASQYVEENVQMRGTQATEATTLLQKQLADLKRRYDEQERSIALFKQRHMGELPEQMEVNLSTLGRLNQELGLNTERQMRIVERKERLAKQLFDISSGTTGHTVINPDSLPHHLEKLRTELTELRTRASAKHPDVRRVQDEIAAIEQALAETAPDAKLDPAQVMAAPEDIKRTLRSLDHDAKNLEAEERRLREELASYQRRVERSAQHSQEFQQLERDYKTTRDLYSSVQQRLGDAQLAETMEQSKRAGQMKIIDPAMPSINPVGPNRLKLFLGGLVLSLALAWGGIMWAEYRDPSFHTVDSLRAFTRVPVLVRIPAIVTKWERRQQYAMATLKAAASAIVLVLIVGASLYVGWGNESLVMMLTETKPQSQPQQSR